MIKLRDLRWRGYPGLSRGTQSITMVLIRGREFSVREGDVTMKAKVRKKDI